MIAQKQTFRRMTICVDGATFTDRTFEGCTLVFSGFIPAHLKITAFSNANGKWPGRQQMPSALWLRCMLKAQAARNLSDGCSKAFARWGNARSPLERRLI